MVKFARELDPVTGPIPRDEFAKIVAAPFGAATKEIRKYDPMWGRTAGEKIKWRVRFTRTVTQVAEEVVEAESEKEAEELADKITDNQLDWDVDDWDRSEVDSIEPLA